MEENNNSQEINGNNSTDVAVAQAPKEEMHYKVPSREALTSVANGNGKILRDHYLIRVHPEVASKLKELKRNYIGYVKDSEGFSYFAIYGSESNSPNDNLFKLIIEENIFLEAGARAELVKGSRSLEDEVLSA